MLKIAHYGKLCATDETLIRGSLMLANAPFSSIAASCSAVVLASCAHVEEHVAAPCETAIVNVHVVTMESDETRRDQVVRIGGGRILSIAPASKGDAGGCRAVIDGEGGYLAPGLIDAHVHVETNAFAQAFGLPEAALDYEMLFGLYLAHGVTGVRVLSGAPDILAFRDSVADTVVPRILVSSPMLSGEPPVLPEPVTRVVVEPNAARAAVAEFLESGYDFIKIRSNLSEDVYRAVLDEAEARGTYVDGHVTRAVGAEAVLQSGQRGFAHLDEFAGAVNTSDDLNKIAQQATQCGCFFVSALSVTASAVDQLADYDAMVARREMSFLHPLLVKAFWLKPNNPYIAQGAPVEFFRELNDQSKLLLKEFVDESVPVVAGSDAMNPMIIPGASLYDELHMMLEAGLAPYQALKTATSNASAHVPGFDDAGVLAEGRAATAVLVSENPLETLETLRRPEAVLLEGRWLDRRDLDALLTQATAQHQAD